MTSTHVVGVVERLRSFSPTYEERWPGNDGSTRHHNDPLPLMREAANLLETQAAEIDHLQKENERLISDAQAAWAKHGGMEIAKGQWQFRALAAEAKLAALSPTHKGI